MKRFAVYQTMFRGMIEVPDEIDDPEAVIDYMDRHDCWPDDFESVETIIEERDE